MKKIALKVAYLGKDFHGFQRQPDIPTVEGELIKAFIAADLFDDIHNAGYSIAGRTDRGVNALGNVLSFRTENEVHINRVNDELPTSIRIIGHKSVHLGFQPRFARERHYRYIIPKNPFEDGLELEKMREAANIFIGTHNYRNFSKRSERNPIRTINSLDIQERNGHLICDIKGESFLWNMVRKIMAAIYSIGMHELDIEEVQEYLDPDKKAYITPLPPQNLILMDVKYDKLQFKEDSYAKKMMISYLKDNYLEQRSYISTYEEMMSELEK